ncbi:hypothetical protein [Thiocystis violacea]|uniref:hypothetical protein n=1 Tax=Thiocystis violacea TaxID=13725 RepID=UPI001F5B6F0B|nr:hypothetical protein [Thiocystis violacea]
MAGGEDCGGLKPPSAIWLLGEEVLCELSEYAHDFRLRDARGRCSLDHGGIWLLELNKFQAEQVETEAQRWLRFFKDGHIQWVEQPRDNADLWHGGRLLTRPRHFEGEIAGLTRAIRTKEWL